MPTDGVDAVILTGADPVFTGGVDLREVAADGVTENPDGNKRQAEDPAQACRDTAKPLICAVNGTCVHRRLGDRPELRLHRGPPIKPGSPTPTPRSG